ncbi:MAG: RidA family protein [Oscillospiraceae bacterium]|nr:RidA family protein [Oscillospiraceae bacterium]
MDIEMIKAEGAPAAIGPYSSAVRAGDLLYISGQLPIDPATGEMPEGIAAQTRQSLKNIEAVLKSAGADLSRVVSANVYMKDLADFGAMNEAYAEFFTSHLPARAAFQVARLPKDALVEIQVVAAL